MGRSEEEEIQNGPPIHGMIIACASNPYWWSCRVTRPEEGDEGRRI